MDDKRQVLDRRNFSFVMVTKEVLKDTTLKASDKAVYSVLCMYAGNDTSECFPSRETLMKESGVSDNTLRKCIRRLKEKGYVDVKERYNRKGQASNMYILLDVSSRQI